jgi:hypothetical protein
MPEDPESMARVSRQVRMAMEAADLSAFSDILDPNVRWGPPGDPSPPCQSRKQVLAWYRRRKNSGARVRVPEVVVLGDRILVGLVVAGTEGARERGGQAARRPNCRHRRVRSTRRGRRSGGNARGIESSSPNQHAYRAGIPEAKTPPPSATSQ